jgi:hypothetical protein
MINRSDQVGFGYRCGAPTVFPFLWTNQNTLYSEQIPMQVIHIGQQPDEEDFRNGST